MTDFRQREILAAKARLNAVMKEDRARGILNLTATQVDRVTLYKAVTHALCYLAQSCGMTHEELSDRMRKDEAKASGSLTLGDALHTRLQGELGLKRVDNAERNVINKTLQKIYRAVDDVPNEMTIEIFVQFVKRHAPLIGLPVDVALTRIENLDALQRFATKGVPQRYIPPSQFGLP